MLMTKTTAITVAAAAVVVVVVVVIVVTVLLKRIPCDTQMFNTRSKTWYKYPTYDIETKN